MTEMMSTLQRDISDLGKKYYAAKVAADCIKLWCTKSPFLNNSSEVSFNQRRSLLSGEYEAICANVAALYKNQNDKAKRERKPV